MTGYPTPTFDGLTLNAPLSVGNGGTGQTTPQGIAGAISATFYTPTLAALRALTSTTTATTCIVANYATAGDQGGGTFVVDASDTTSADNGGTIIVDAAGRRWYRQFSGAVNVRWFGAKGDGSTDDTSSINAAFAVVLSYRSNAIYFPTASVGYLVTAPINLTDHLGGIKIYGDGQISPLGGQATANPTNGSIILGNTGTNNPIIDCSGTANVFFHDITFACLGLSAASKIGVLSGKTTTESNLVSGGNNVSFTNVSMFMTNSGSSYGIANVNGSSLTYINCQILANTPIYLSSNNVNSLSSPFKTFSLGTGVDAVYSSGCSLLSYGNIALIIEGSACHTWEQLYIVTIVNGSTYTGTTYPVLINGCTDINLNVEVDYYPSVFELTGNCNSIRIKGVGFANTTPIPANQAFFGLLNCSAPLVNCSFDLTSASGAVTNFGYVAAKNTGFTYLSSCSFSFNTANSTNICFFNIASGGPTVPFLNLKFNGDADATTVDLEIAGTAASASQYRYFMNGKLVGTG